MNGDSRWRYRPQRFRTRGLPNDPGICSLWNFPRDSRDQPDCGNSAGRKKIQDLFDIPHSQRFQTRCLPPHLPIVIHWGPWPGSACFLQPEGRQEVLILEGLDARSKNVQIGEILLANSQHPQTGKSEATHARSSRANASCSWGSSSVKNSSNWSRKITSRRSPR